MRGASCSKMAMSPLSNTGVSACPLTSRSRSVGSEGQPLRPPIARAGPFDASLWPMSGGLVANLPSNSGGPHWPASVRRPCAGDLVGGERTLHGVLPCRNAGDIIANHLAASGMTDRRRQFLYRSGVANKGHGTRCQISGKLTMGGDVTRDDSGARHSSLEDCDAERFMAGETHEYVGRSQPLVEESGGNVA